MALATSHDEPSHTRLQIRALRPMLNTYSKTAGQANPHRIDELLAGCASFKNWGIQQFDENPIRQQEKVKRDMNKEP